MVVHLISYLELVMKCILPALACMILGFSVNWALPQAQKSEPKKGEFRAGEPLGTINESKVKTPMTSNVKVYGSFHFAESCTFDPERNLIVVMNAGNTQKLQENDGYVSLINPDGSVHTSKWIGVTRDGLTLNHPLGSAIQGRTLYAADIDTVRTFDLNTGKPGDAHPIKGATILNGIGVTKEGTIYVSNTSKPECIYKITKDGAVSTFVEGKPLDRPNGIAIDNDGNIVSVNIGDTAVLTFSPQGKLK